MRVYGKGQKERVVWLTQSLWAVMLAWRQVRPAVDDDHLFLNNRGQPISIAGIQYRLQQHARAAGVAGSCHRLRHTFARRLVEQGLAVDSLAKLLGHQQLATTQHYIDGADPNRPYRFYQGHGTTRNHPQSSSTGLSCAWPT